MTNPLLAFPTVLSCAILCDWINVQGLVRVDSAHCSTQSRKLFLALCSHEDFIIVRSRYCKYINEQPKFREISAFSWLMSRSIKLQDVVLHREVSLKLKQSYLLRNGRHIRSIHGGYTITEIEAKAISRNCPFLTSLIIRSDGESNFELLPYLRKLKVYLRHDVLKPHIFDILMRQVNHLEVDGAHFTEQKALAIVSGCPALQKLSLIHWWQGHNQIQLTSPIIETCQNLRTLQCNFADDTALLCISTYCKRIVHLDLAGSKCCTDTGMAHILSYLQLRSLVLPYNSQISNTTVQNLATYCATSLRLLWVRQQEQYGAEAVAREEWDVELLHQKCTRMHTFRWSIDCVVDLVFLAATHTTDLCLFITVADAALVVIGQRCKALLHLALISDLKDVTPGFTSAGVRAVVRGCPNLQSICFDQEEDMSHLCDFVAEYPGLCTADAYHLFHCDIMSMPV